MLVALGLALDFLELFAGAARCGAGFIFLAFCAALAAISALGMDEQTPDPVGDLAVDRRALSIAVVLACLAVVLQNAGIGPLGTFV